MADDLTPAPDASVSKLLEHPTTPAGLADGDAPPNASTRPERPKLNVSAFKAQMAKANLLGLDKTAPPPQAQPAADPDDDEGDDMAAATRVETPVIKPAADAATAVIVDPAGAAGEELPAVAPNPQVVAAWERVAEMEKGIQAREAALADREQRATDMGRSFIEDPYAALRGIAVAHLGEGATDDEVAAEVADIVSDLSVKQGNVTLNPKDPLIERRRLDRELRHSRAERRALAKQGQEADVQRKADSENAATVTRLGQELKTTRKDKAGKDLPPVLSEFPYLAASENPEALVFDLIQRHHDKTGEILGRKGDGPFDIAVAARLCEGEIREAATRIARRYGSLLQTTTTQTPKPTPAANQGDPPKRRSIAAKPADASNLEVPKTPPAPRQYSEEEHREETLSNFRSLMAARRQGEAT